MQPESGTKVKMIELQLMMNNGFKTKIDSLSHHSTYYLSWTKQYTQYIIPYRQMLTKSNT